MIIDEISDRILKERERKSEKKLVKSRQLIYCIDLFQSHIVWQLPSWTLLDCRNHSIYLDGVSLLLLLVLLGVVDLVLLLVAELLPDEIADLVLVEAPVPGANRTLPGVSGVELC